jgi:hypothetical protein
VAICVWAGSFGGATVGDGSGVAATKRLAALQDINTNPVISEAIRAYFVFMQSILSAPRDIGKQQ